ncbi:MAG TPA: class I SAM-dependent methyltransferase, partial [Anaerolineae bacterium]
AKTFSSFTYPRDLPLIIAAFRYRRYEMCPDEIWHVTDSFGGFLRRREAGLIYWAAHNWPAAGPVIELGSYEGCSTVIFALAGRFVHAVDAWSMSIQDLSAYQNRGTPADTVFEQFLKNTRRAQVQSRISVHRGLTQEVSQTWTTPCAILFVDAGHTYDDVRSDLHFWTPFLMSDGLLLMHDVIYDGFPGVTRAASELLRKGWRVIASADSLVALTRK